MFSNANNTHKVDAIDPFSLISLVHQLSRPTKHAHLLFPQLHSAVALISSAASLTHPGFGCSFCKGTVKYKTKQESVNPCSTHPHEFPLRSLAQQAPVHGQPSEMGYFNPPCVYKNTSTAHSHCTRLSEN